ncbi:apoptosis-inducing factor 1, mitochondrial isoform X2 [Aplysia californica]|uniref:Apoptosis-inducing factor 1, mitochondrial isoform X2 n=1 Tax=Aplysia californica TaxID=6500 RepID=A0ABM1AE07_APLCA|nr:apoptosis-inducing factor 1, mitochondrial isoform X2 [Aplysia californica]
MDRVHTLCRRTFALQNLKRIVAQTQVSRTPVVVQARCMGGHHTPDHWKPIKQVVKEQKNHMDFMPVPEGSWQESFNKTQQKRNLMLAAGALCFGITYTILYKTGCLELHAYTDFSQFKYKTNGSNEGAASSSSEEVQEDNSNNNAAATPDKGQGDAGESGAAGGIEPDLKDLPEVPQHAQYLLIGAGTATFGAFRAIKSKDPTAKILVIGEESVVPYMRPPLSKELWFNDNKEEVDSLQFKQWNGKKRSIFYEPKEFFADPRTLNTLEKGGIALLTGRKVVKVDASKKKVWLASGETLTYDKCLIATGGKPRNIPVLAKADPEVQKRTVLFRNVEDFKSLDRMTQASESIAIVGGGFLGSELACALGKRGKDTGLRVYQLFPEKGNMGRVLPEYLSKWTTRKVENEGVTVLPNHTVSGASFKDGKVVIATKEGGSVCVDGVVAAVGLEPNIELAQASGLEVDPVNGGYLVNAELEARRDLWVAGDAACFYDMKLGRRRVEHHDHAVVSGRLAGENMTGAAKPYWHQSMFWSDLGPEVGYEAIGIVDSSLPTVAVFAKSTEQDTPKAVVEKTGESLRSETENTASPAPLRTPPPSSPLDSEDYGKGIVFYLNKSKVVVGILLWNTFNKMSIARQVLKDGAKNEDLYEVAKLFDIYDTQSEQSAAGES